MKWRRSRVTLGTSKSQGTLHWFPIFSLQVTWLCFVELILLKLLLSKAVWISIVFGLFKRWILPNPQFYSTKTPNLRLSIRLRKYLTLRSSSFSSFSIGLRKILWRPYLHGWKAKLFSQAGRATIIKSICCSCFPILHHDYCFHHEFHPPQVVIVDKSIWTPSKNGDLLACSVYKSLQPPPSDNLLSV